MICLDHREVLISNPHKQERESLLMATHWQETEPKKRKVPQGLQMSHCPLTKVTAHPPPPAPGKAFPEDTHGQIQKQRAFLGGSSCALRLDLATAAPCSVHHLCNTLSLSSLELPQLPVLRASSESPSGEELIATRGPEQLFVPVEPERRKVLCHQTGWY